MPVHSLLKITATSPSGLVCSRTPMLDPLVQTMPLGWIFVFVFVNFAHTHAIFRRWEAPSGSSVQFSVPDDWKAGRIWGRTSCNFATNPGPTSCVTGGCNGGLECAAQAGTGVPPASLAEWTLQGDGNRDFYDVSLVDGFNLPVAITNNVGCPVANCPVDLNPGCPAELRGPANPDGSNAGCKSACLANLDGNQQDSANCCSGSHNTPATCPASGVQFYDYFKGNCKNSYAYAFDEASGTALWTCDSGLKADYTLTFCP
ncbi:hypothetical protein E1B28_005790 [Marasmius oreades]|uniref:Thaumatin-like protein n=1 Tax=Marasmius oreades TaxID=181124 RepID=A0A9P7S3Z6_9AGAR|nr:uncharacterized protein E1B28_005790 [Marasmius oreades]KAG7094994.1 hypothetical protein E1B28_005790 [Marasmius oreades]